ncbi:formyltetrahydrofolate-dependent phosphoribosylglycinamide formyltransferase [Sulfuritortus calidifontis]|uniref:Phosphoribosylglycinamide formyltransferase n=2 Tax=Sulfuritortus calidifontis TaxID=1914471 RepID=A0A4R3K0L8_9PROT|nr:formyltetrahydrofolate-dependent phosphoribosylglycinamide formyltransferase [Sulfuritortus calidifontis]
MRVVVLISGRGSNMEALLRAGLPVEFAAVISNKAEAKGLAVARELGVETAVVNHKDYPSREAYDAKLAEVIDGYGADLVCLAGFMRILSDGFVNRYAGRMINIHPSLLPAFTGLDTHARAIAAGVKLHGCTVHYVTPELDAGPIVVQAAVPVLEDDTPDSLGARVLEQEHRIYPLAVRWIAEGRVELSADGRARVRSNAPAANALISPAG